MCRFAQSWNNWVQHWTWQVLRLDHLQRHVTHSHSVYNQCTMFMRAQCMLRMFTSICDERRSFEVISKRLRIYRHHVSHLNTAKKNVDKYATDFMCIVVVWYIYFKFLYSGTPSCGVSVKQEPVEDVTPLLPVSEVRESSAGDELEVIAQADETRLGQRK